jgi:hypothetical protein
MSAIARQVNPLLRKKDQLPNYKLNAIGAELMASDVHVNNFYCEPTGDMA